MTDQSVLRTLSLTFDFPGARADEVAEVLRTAPLIGTSGLLGTRTAQSTQTDGDTRWIMGFEPLPVPLVRFDVKVSLQKLANDTFLVTEEFSQPWLERPYLAGQFVWILSDDPDGGGAVIHEEINTATALQIVDRPLHGRRFSLRRFLFFHGGHEHVMNDLATNVRRHLGERSTLAGGPPC